MADNNSTQTREDKDEKQNKSQRGLKKTLSRSNSMEYNFYKSLEPAPTRQPIRMPRVDTELANERKRNTQPEHANTEESVDVAFEKSKIISRRVSVPAEMHINPEPPKRQNSFENPLRNLTIEETKKQSMQRTSLLETIKHSPESSKSLQRIHALVPINNSHDLITGAIIADKINKRLFSQVIKATLNAPNLRLLHGLQTDPNNVLNTAIDTNDLSLTKLALSNGAYPDADVSKETSISLLEKAFFKFKKKPDVTSCKLLEALKEHSNYPNIVPNISEPTHLLYFAVTKQKFELVEYAIQKGASPDTTIGFNQDKSISQTALKISNEVLQKGTSVNDTKTATRISNFLSLHSSDTETKNKIEKFIETRNKLLSKINKKNKDRTIGFR
jgi:hypothetical protein